MCSSEKMPTKTKMLSTDSGSSTRYAAKYSVAALLPWVAATPSPIARPSPIHTPTHTTLRDQGASASVPGARIETSALRHRSPPRTEIEKHDLHRGRAPASPLAHLRNG